MFQNEKRWFSTHFEEEKAWAHEKKTVLTAAQNILHTFWERKSIGTWKKNSSNRCAEHSPHILRKSIGTWKKNSSNRCAERLAPTAIECEWQKVKILKNMKQSLFEQNHFLPISYGQMMIQKRPSDLTESDSERETARWLKQQIAICSIKPLWKSKKKYSPTMSRSK